MERFDFASEIEEEIIGGLNNGINRGETINSARISLLNAGYSPQIVDVAVRRIMEKNKGSVVEQKVPQKINVPSSNLNLHANNFPVSKQNSINQPYPASRTVPYWAVVLMLLLSLGIIVGAGVLGLYWNRLFI